MTSPMVVLRTVKDLHLAQVTGRIRRRLFPLRWLPSAAAGLRLKRRPASLPAERRDGGFRGDRFHFLNRTHLFSGNDRWLAPGAERLWLYNLHYFEFLHGISPDRGLGLIRDWIGANTDPRGPGWEPYPLSIRVREWIEWVQEHPDLEEATVAEIVTSLVRQVTALAKQIEYNIGGNHLLENAITMCWAGFSLDGPVASGWRETGGALLRRCLEDQLLEDGIHNERSPMYQALLAQALLRLAEVCRCSVGEQQDRIGEGAEVAGRRMLEALSRLVHPDGSYALLNDTALGIAPPSFALINRFGVSREEAHSGSWDLNASGYSGRTGPDGTALIFDSGEIGPDNQPGHGHADALSFELSLRGRRFITDTGTFTYSRGETRLRDRGTAAHNTVTVDDHDQAELWSAFRCGAKIRVEERGVSSMESGSRHAGSIVACSGSWGSWRHKRVVETRESCLDVRDRLKTRGPHIATWRLHLAPGVEATHAGQSVRITEDGGCLAHVVSADLTWRVRQSAYHPEFGVEIERTCLEAQIPFVDECSAGFLVQWD